MSDTQAFDDRLSLTRRILRTPIFDLLRGRLIDPVAGNLSTILAASSLPAPITNLIADVIRRTRLWRSEKAGVALELVAHFADGLSAGMTPEELISRFGDTHRSARLIRRAKQRNRPLLWHAWRYFCYGFLALCGFYALLAIYYYTGKPTPTIDYVALLNKPILATPADQRAWPIYRQVIIDLKLTSPEQIPSNGDFSKMLDALPGSKRWPALLSWLNQHRADINLLHQAANRPQLGFVLGPGGSAYDPVVFPGLEPSKSSSMYDVAMPSLQPLRQIARIFYADATAATEAGDRARYLRDIHSLLELTEQARQHPSLVAELVSIGIRAFTYEQIGRTLSSKHVSMLTDDDLRDLAHQLAGPEVASDLFDFQYERMFFHDIIQRAYTDGGLGGGHLTPAGVQFFQHISNSSFSSSADHAAALQAIALPASLLVVAPRQEEIRLYDHLLDQAEALLRQPLRQADWDSWDRQLSDLKGSLLASIHNYPIGLCLPALSRFNVTAERCLGVRDGLLCALALEAYHRRHDNQYPASLSALTPGLLPHVPLDRITGAPLHYLLRDGHPVIYSLGDDHLDNHGTPPAKRPYNAAQWTNQNPTPGDWVLYPDPTDTPPNDD